MTKLHRECVLCKKKIARRRVLALPATRVCRGCSDERKVTEADVDLDGADQEEQVRAVVGDGSQED